MRYNVHVYAVVRIKVAVHANDHQEAMEAADDILARNADLLQWYKVPPELEASIQAPMILHCESAEETVGYLVDEDGDDEHENSRFYDEERRPVKGDV